uniref:Sodium/nucleoside cotransporter n=1 Tax=Biomphalaria glabrata TaxID=6526 RepID=A0A2C9L044_BIOGL
MSSMTQQNGVGTEEAMRNGDLHREDVELKEVRVQDETTNETTRREADVKHPLLEEQHVVEVEDYRLNDDDREWSDDDAVEEKKDVSSLKYGFVSRAVLGSRDFCRRKLAFVVSKTRGYLLSVILLLGYLAYFIAAMCYRFEDESSHRLLGCTILGLIIVSRKFILTCFRKLFFRITGSDHVTLVWKKRLTTCRFFLRWIMYGLMCGIIIWVIVDKAIADPNNLRSIPGILIILLICLFCSNSPNKVNYHTIFWSVGLQFLLALYVLKWKYGKASVTWVQERISEFFDNSDAGSRLIFGDNYKEHYLIFAAFPLLFFINGMMTVLYYCGAMQLIINVVGSTLTFVLGTSAVESMAVAAGVFMEGVASLTAFKPYLGGLSKSELFLVITSCFSSIGSTFLAILSQIGVSVDLVIGAMLISAPATFTVCKLLMPETKLKKQDKMSDIGNLEKNKYPSILDAFQSGAAAMAAAFSNVVISAFALVSLISWVNKTLEWFGDRVGVRSFTIELIASYLLYPVALGMGVELDDCRKVATVFGYRLGSSNVIAFLKLAELKRNRLRYENYVSQFGSNATLTFQNDDVILNLLGQTLKQGFISVRSEAILTYSLCGFASMLSVAIHLGIMCAFLPKKKKWISRICFVALFAGNLANIMTGCFACLFF